MRLVYWHTTYDPGVKINEKKIYSRWGFFKEGTFFFHKVASTTFRVITPFAILSPAFPYCPPGEGVLHNKSSSCFQIFPEELSWMEARQQCLSRSGDLAVVRSDELRALLSPKVTQWVKWALSIYLAVMT